MPHNFNIRLKADEFKRKLNIKDGEPGPMGSIGPIGKTGLKGPKGLKGEKGLVGKKGKDGVDGQDGTDGSPDTPIEIRDKLETLDGNYRLDAKAIKNLPIFGTAFNEKRITSTGHTIQDEGTNLTKRTNLNFVGAGVTVTDDAANDQTDVTIPGGVTDHGALTGLADDDHAQYALLAGRAGGQTLIGGTGTTDDLILRTTSGVGTTGADMIFQVGNGASPTEAMRIANNGTIGHVIFRSPTNSTTAFQFLNQFASPVMVLDTTNRRVGIGGYASVPATTLHVQEDSVGQTGFYVVNSGTGGGTQASFLCGNFTTGARYAYFSHFGTNWTTDGLWIASRSMLQGADTGGLLLNTHNATTGHMIFATGGHAAADERMRFDVSGRMGISGTSTSKVTSPTALLHLAAGTATANTAPLKFNSGTLLTTAEALAVEALTDNLHFTITTGAARKGIMLDDGTRLTSGKIPIATTNGRLTDGQTPLSGTKIYFVADTSGGAVTRKLTFIDGILTAEV